MLLARRIPTLLPRGRGPMYLRDGTDPVSVMVSSTNLITVTDLHSRMRGSHRVGVSPTGRVTLVGQNVQGAGSGSAMPPFPISEVEATPGLPDSGPQTYGAQFVVGKAGVARRGADVVMWHQDDDPFAAAAAVLGFGEDALLLDANGVGTLVDLPAADPDGNGASSTAPGQASSATPGRTVLNGGKAIGTAFNFGDRALAVAVVQVENGYTVIQQASPIAQTVQGVNIPWGNVRNGRSDVRVIDGTGIVSTTAWDSTGQVASGDLPYLQFHRGWLRPTTDLGTYQGDRIFAAFRVFDGWYAQPLSGTWSNPVNAQGTQYLLYQLTRDSIVDQVIVRAKRDGTLSVVLMQGLEKRSRTPIQCWRQTGTNSFFARSGNSLTTLSLSQFPTNNEAIVRPWPVCRLGSTIYGPRGTGFAIVLKFDLATGAVSGTAQVPAGQNPVPMALPHDNLLITQTNDGNAPNYAVSRDGGKTWSKATLQGGLPSLPAASLQPLYPVTS